MRRFWKDYLTDDEMKIVLFLLVFAVIGIGLRYTSLTAENDPELKEELDISKDYEIKYDLNTVTAGELITIPGIGEKKAADIISFREQGGFYSKSDLMKIKGIGPATYAKIEKYFCELGDTVPIFSDQAEEIAEIDETPLDITKININTASIDQLISLKGIGKTKAEAIIEYRKTNDKFQKVDDLLNVKGIGSKTLEKIRDKISTGVENE